jgi:hypothetical protein
MASKRMNTPSPTHAQCGDSEHSLHRRTFLQGAGFGLSAAASAMSFNGLFADTAVAAQARRDQKKCILIWLTGAPSQFETWDPKPGTSTGGPFHSIPTAVPGTHVCELMPKCASIMDKLAIIRSMKTDSKVHANAIQNLTRGDLPRPPFTRPTLGSVVSEQLGQPTNGMPGFVLLDPNAEGNEFKRFKEGNFNGWLDAEHAPVRAGGAYTIANAARQAGLAPEDFDEREALRSMLSQRYEEERRSALAAGHNTAFGRVKGMMESASLFEIDRLSKKDRLRYGPGAYGLHVLLARHLVENDANFVMVANGMPWDTHNYNHEAHQLLVPELDRAVFHLINDLEERSMLDNTLVVVMGEFGRSPWLSASAGRDHYSNAWSMAMAGCGIQGGAVHGATDDHGVDVTTEPVDERRLFATIFKALGIDPHGRYESDIQGFPAFHRVEDNAQPVHEILA